MYGLAGQEAYLIFQIPGLYWADVSEGLLVISIAILVCFLVIGSLRSVCIRLYARDRGGDCSLEEPLPTAKRNA